MSRKKSTLNLEQAFAQLETVVEQLERGDLPLEEALKQFEQGVELTRICQKILTESEQKVDILMKDKPQPFMLEEGANGAE